MILRDNRTKFASVRLRAGSAPPDQVQMSGSDAWQGEDLSPLLQIRSALSSRKSWLNGSLSVPRPSAGSEVALLETLQDRLRQDARYLHAGHHTAWTAC